MKRIFLYSLAVMALAVTSSCEKFLESDSPSSFTEEYIYSNETDATKAVNNIYALFNQDAFTSRVSNNFAGNSDIEVGSVNASPSGDRRDIWSFEATSANRDLLIVWNNAYSAINRANESIEGIESSDLFKSGNSRMRHLLGEAKGLRAIWYWYLINHWGDVPLKLTATKAGDDFYLPRTDRNVVLSAIIDDLIAVEPMMMWADQLTYGREQINREFVMGMIARLSLMRGGYGLYPGMVQKRADDYLKYYEIANDYCRKLMSLKPHALNPDFAKVFIDINGYQTPENEDVLFEVAFHPGFGDVAWNNGVRVDAGEHPFGSGSNYLSLTPNYYYSFDTLDTRLEATCSIIMYDKDLLQQPVAVTSIAPNKWNRLLMPKGLGKGTNKGTGINWPLMRYSDVLLMLAETENEINNGPTADAKEALRKVRNRAFPEPLRPAKVETYIASVSASKESFFEAIVNERAWEFGGECLRKYDLIRWGNYGKKVAEARETCTQMGMDQVTDVGPYAKLADYLYYKRNSNGTITFLNRYEDPSVVPPVKDSPTVGDNPDGYLRTAWLRTNILYDSGKNQPGSFITNTWRGYSDNTGLSPLRYILPLHQEVITSSLGKLSNDGYGFN